MITIQSHVSLKPYNTFAVDVRADFFVEVHNEQDIYDLIASDIFSPQSHLILGGGANILFTKNYTGIVVKVSLLGKEVIQQEGNTVYIKVGAGENRHDLAMWTLAQGYVGMENLVLIPGNVGAAPVGNIGAYGKETKDVVYEVEGIDMTSKEKKVRTNSECMFGYRDSIFKNALKNKIIITAVTFQLQKQSPEYLPNIQYNEIQNSIAAQGIDPSNITAQQVADIIIESRQKKLPDRTKIGTAGSFFKNPVVTKDQYEKLLLKYPDLKGNSVPQGVKIPAGQLIDLAGFRGKREGTVGTYDNHALIIVNNGGASGTEIQAFAQSIQKKVLELFEITLEPEVMVL